MESVILDILMGTSDEITVLRWVYTKNKEMILPGRKLSLGRGSDERSEEMVCAGSRDV